MKVTREDIQLASTEVGLDAEKGAALLAALERRSAAHGAAFNLANAAYYLGGLIILAAMTFFVGLGWEIFGGWGLFLIGSLYIAAFVGAGRHLYFEKGLHVPGGLLYVVAVGVVPLAIYGLEKGLGFWPDGEPGSYRDYHVYVKGTWIVMELGTLAAGALALRSVRFPFLVAPVAFTLWYMSMDLVPWIFAREDFSWDERKWVSIGFGLFILVAAAIVDKKVKEDFAFWLYLFGLMAFWGGLSSMSSDSEVGKVIYCAINLKLILVGVLLGRRTFAVFGGMGVFGYLGHLAWRVFEGSLLFPFALSLLGLGIIAAGVVFQKNEARLSAGLKRALPTWFTDLIPATREV
jgi:hypothetical protein